MHTHILMDMDMHICLCKDFTECFQRTQLQFESLEMFAHCFAIKIHCHKNRIHRFVLYYLFQEFCPDLWAEQILLFFSIGDWTQGLLHAKQGSATKLYCQSFNFETGCKLPMLVSNLPSFCIISCVAGITGVCTAPCDYLSFLLDIRCR